VCKFYDVEEGDLAAVRRGVRNEPRDVAIYLLRTICGELLMQIGQAFGMTQYSSVSSAVMRINEKLQNNRRFSKRMNAVKESIKKGSLFAHRATPDRQT
jgi:putative transposase